MKHKLLGIFTLLLAVVFGMQAQSIPQDTTVMKGQLPNGLTYYVRANKQKENRANFYIVQKVGSILENEDQRGLAHFLEHMAFNGTKNFPNNEEGKGIIDYLESIGVKFGAQLNAYTAMDQTVYNINEVPTDVKGATDSVLLILADWSHSLLLRDKDIDKERKVIHEEWRTRRSVGSRMIDSIAPIIFNGSKYAERMPIGLMSVVDNFKPEALRAYYHKWYRPDLQGIIVVGDIDADAVVAKIKELFGPIPMPENAAVREYEQVPPTGVPLAAIAMDKEMQLTNISVSFRREPIPAQVKQTPMYPAIQFAMNAVTSMFNNRFKELLQKPNQPIVYAYVNDGAFFGIKTLDALQVNAGAKPGKSKEAIQLLLTEIERVKRYGFTAGELENVSKEIVMAAENRYKERSKQRNGYYISEYINNFLNDEPLYSIETQYQMAKMMSQAMTIDKINMLVKDLFPSDNEVLAIMAALSDKETLPSKEDAEQMMVDASKIEVKAYEDNTVKAPLLEKLPEAGKVLSETTKGEATIWELSNGAKVVFQPTDFKDDQVLVIGSADGGKTGVDLSVPNFKFFDELVSVGGLGVHDKVSLSKVLSGKNVGASFSANNYLRNISASSGKKEVKEMMQLIYMNVMQVRKDVEAFQVMQEQFKSYLGQLRNNPSFVFQDSISRAVSNNDPYELFPTVEELQNVNYDQLLETQKVLAENASAFTFYIVGNTDKATLKPLVEQYIASLPAGKKDAIKVKALPVRLGKFDNNFKRELETHKASTAIFYKAYVPYTYENKLKMSVLKQIFDMEYIDVIREKAGGTYGVQVRGSLDRLPKSSANLTFTFDSEPARRAELVKLMDEVVERIQKEGPRAEHLDKIKKYEEKTYTDGLKENGMLVRKLMWQTKFNYDVDANFMKILDGITAKSMADFAKQIFSQGNRIEVSMSDSNKSE